MARVLAMGWQPELPARADWISKRKTVTQRNDGLLERRSMDQRNLYRVVSVELLNNYVRQGCEREAGK